MSKIFEAHTIRTLLQLSNSVFEACMRDKASIQGFTVTRSLSSLLTNLWHYAVSHAVTQ